MQINQRRQGEGAGNAAPDGYKPNIPLTRLTDPTQILDLALFAEIEANCEMYSYAWIQFHDLLKRPPPVEASVESQTRLRLWAHDVWGSTYSMLGAAGRILRVLWEVNGSKEFRGRSHLNIQPTLQKESPLRSVRNALEHVETRIPAFTRVKTDGALKGWGITNEVPDDDPLPLDSFRHLNFRTYRVSIRDQAGEHTCNLSEIREAVNTLLGSFQGNAAGMMVVLGPRSGA